MFCKTLNGRSKFRKNEGSKAPSEGQSLLSCFLKGFWSPWNAIFVDFQASSSHFFGSHVACVETCVKHFRWKDMLGWMIRVTRCRSIDWLIDRVSDWLIDWFGFVSSYSGLGWYQSSFWSKLCTPDMINFRTVMDLVPTWIISPKIPVPSICPLTCLQYFKRDVVLNPKTYLATISWVIEISMTLPQLW